MSWVESNSSIVRNFIGIRNQFVNFCPNLFPTVNIQFPIHMEDLITHSLTESDADDLVSIPFAEEVCRVVFSMSNGKSPSPEGMSPIFFEILLEHY